MANIVLSNPQFYKGGKAGASQVVGFDSGVNRVVRYSFTPPSVGANKVSLSFKGNWKGSDNIVNSYRFYIGTDPDSHISAGAGYSYTGQVTRKTNTYEYYGSAEIIILPNRTYYVFVFPITSDYGWIQWSQQEGDATLEASGGSYSTISAQTFTLGTEANIKVTKYNESYTHTIKYKIGSVSGTICQKSSATNIPWKPSIELAKQITSSTSGTAEITITSYSGSTLIGSAPSAQFTLKVPSSVVPTVTATITDLSDGFEQFGVFTQNVSFLSVSTDSSGSYGSTIKKTEILLDGEAYSGGIVKTSGEKVLSVVVTDSRGRTGKYSKTLTFYEYYAPSVSVSASRCDENGNADESGEFAKIKIISQIYQVNGKNTAKVTLTYGSKTEEISVSVGTVTTTKQVSAPSVSSLKISAIASDKIKQSTKYSMTLGVGFATMDFLAGGKGVAFGTTATKEALECAMPAVFTGGVSGSGLGVESKEYPGCYYRIANGATEWLNPPMVIGKEYRTTRRWEGKPVYQKATNFGALPNNSYASTAVSAEGRQKILSICGFVTNESGESRPIPYATTYSAPLRGAVDLFARTTGSATIAVIISTDFDASGWTATVIVRYTKSTD